MPHGGLPVLSGSLNPIILRGSVLNLIELRLLPFVLGARVPDCESLLRAQARAAQARDNGIKCGNSAMMLLRRLQRAGEEYLAEGFLFCLGRVGFPFRPLGRQ